MIKVKVGTKEDIYIYIYMFLVDTGAARSSLTFQPQDVKFQTKKLLGSGEKGEGSKFLFLKIL